jgi:hypothetical protein
MKRVSAMAFALMISVSAYGRNVTLPKADIAHTGLSIAALKPVRFMPRRHGYGVVVSPKKIIEAAGQLRLLEAARHLANSSLARTRILSAAPYHVSEAELEKAEALSDRAMARVAMTKASLRADYGPVLAQAVIGNTRLLKNLEFAKIALVEVSLPLPPIAQPPAIAQARLAMVRAANAGFITLRRIGLAGAAPAGLIGQEFFYAAPYLQAGSTLMVRLVGGAARRGVVVPASALVYLKGRAFVFEQTSPTSFKLDRIPTTAPERSHHRLTGYFVPTDQAPREPVVIHGAGFLLAILGHPKG